eukprot:3510911-Rhodomonas_salina.4
MRGTGIGYAATACSAMSVTDIGYAATRPHKLLQPPSPHPGKLSAYACYAVSGTDIAYGGILCPCYAMSGTDVLYAATSICST